MDKKMIVIVFCLLIITSSLAVSSYEGLMEFGSSNESVDYSELQTDVVILILAFPTEFYDYGSNYTFFCPGRGIFIWITPVVKIRKIFGAVLPKDKFFGIASPLIVLGIRVTNI